jgi:uncharacterized protein YbjT (DUF2867 family)
LAANSALIAGASGLVGSHLVPLLLKRYECVIALTRRELPVVHPRFEQHIVDFDQLPSFGAPTDVYCALGTTLKKAGSRAAFRRVDYDYPLAVARHAADAGSRQFLLVSSIGADRRSSNFYLRTKGELEDATGALPFHSLHIFRPSLIIGERAERRTGARIGMAAMRVIAPALAGALRQYRPISAGALAQSMVAAAARAEVGRHIYTFNDFLRAAR